MQICQYVMYIMKLVFVFKVYVWFRIHVWRRNLIRSRSAKSLEKYFVYGIELKFSERINWDSDCLLIFSSRSTHDEY